jgi:hypothetical protein
MSFDQRKTREWTNLLQDAISGGLISPRDVVDMCMSYMSEFDVEDMCRSNDLAVLLKPEEEENEDDE